MKTLPIPRLHELLYYIPETGLIFRKASAGCLAANTVVGTPSTSGHLSVGIDKAYYKVHRVAWAMYHGRWPELEIDHINGVRDDNRISNLREVSKVINAQNLAITGRANNLSGRRGVYKLNDSARAKPWLATINANKKSIHLGSFRTYEEACVAREAAELVYYTDHPKRTI